jgi:hypothetical protein
MSLDTYGSETQKNSRSDLVDAWLYGAVCIGRDAIRQWPLRIVAAIVPARCLYRRILEYSRPDPF